MKNEKGTIWFVRVPNRIASQAVQRQLFTMGYSWYGTGQVIHEGPVKTYGNEACLAFIPDSGRIEYSAYSYWSDADDAEELTMDRLFQDDKSLVYKVKEVEPATSLAVARRDAEFHGLVTRKEMLKRLNQDRVSPFAVSRQKWKALRSVAECKDPKCEGWNYLREESKKCGDQHDLLGKPTCALCETFSDEVNGCERCPLSPSNACRSDEIFGKAATALRRDDRTAFARHAQEMIDAITTAERPSQEKEKQIKAPDGKGGAATIKEVETWTLTENEGPYIRYSPPTAYNRWIMSEGPKSPTDILSDSRFLYFSGKLPDGRSWPDHWQHCFRIYWNRYKERSHHRYDQQSGFTEPVIAQNAVILKVEDGE